MSKEQVKASETLPIAVERADSLGYVDKMFNNDYLVVYTFNNDKLNFSAYGLANKLSDDTEYVTHVTFLEEVLTQKYGPSKEPEVKWEKDTSEIDFQDAKKNPLKYVKSGYCKYVVEWDAPDTLVALNLYGNENKLAISVFYRSKAFLPHDTGNTTKTIEEKL